MAGKSRQAPRIRFLPPRRGEAGGAVALARGRSPCMSALPQPFVLPEKHGERPARRHASAQRSLSDRRPFGRRSALFANARRHGNARSLRESIEVPYARAAQLHAEADEGLVARPGGRAASGDPSVTASRRLQITPADGTLVAARPARRSRCGAPEALHGLAWSVSRTDGSACRNSVWGATLRRLYCRKKIVVPKVECRIGT